MKTLKLAVSVLISAVSLAGISSNAHADWDDSFSALKCVYDDQENMKLNLMTKMDAKWKSTEWTSVDYTRTHEDYIWVAYNVTMVMQGGLLMKFPMGVICKDDE